MIRQLSIMLADSYSIGIFLLFAAFMFSGLTVCLAIALYVTHAALLQPQTGMDWFFSVMSFSGAGMAEPLRMAVELVNWTAFVGIVVIFMQGVLSYSSSVNHRVKESRSVIRFPIAERSDSDDDSLAANG